uniref:Uncharacterized protein n=1 Tax=Anopheles christyi TaxID=43041 RepID=A0A182JPG1_9DIPT
MAAAVGSLISRSTVNPAIVAASNTACRCPSENWAGTAITVQVTDTSSCLSAIERNRINVCLRQRFLADESTLFGERDYRWNAMVATLVGNNFEFAISVNTYARETGAKIDSYRDRRSGSMVARIIADPNRSKLQEAEHQAVQINYACHSNDQVASMPNTGVEEEYYRLRHFSITGKGVVNRGDSLKSRRSKSNNSVASSNSSTEHLTPAAGAVAAGSARTSATCSLASSRESSTSNPASGPYKVLMLGGPAVGKSSLVSQFMTSEYLHAGEESELTFIDHSFSEMAPENCMSTYDPHGYCVIYSSTDKETFFIAERILQILWTTENIAQKAVILVANKADLARCRVVTSDEGKAMATQYDCKFIETSVGINHNVDELLVGLLSQIRLKLENPEKSRDLFRKRSIRKSKRRACSPLGGAICLTGIGGSTNPSTPVSGPPVSGGGGFVDTPPGSAHSSPRKYRGSRTSASLKVKGLLGRVWARDSKSKSCENLHVL